MDNQNNDPNAGFAGDGSYGNSDSGNQGGDQSQNSNPGGQNGNNSNSGNDVAQLRQEVRRLNQALVESRRGSGNNQNQNSNGNAQDPNDPINQYGIALSVATGKLRGDMESRISLYPEVDQKEIQRIRNNPWAFASQEAYQNGDVNQALDEIEQYLLDLAEANNPQGQDGNTDTSVQSANVNANPAPTTNGEPTAPGSEEDTNPNTMPMDKLEREAAKARAKLSAQGK